MTPQLNELREKIIKAVPGILSYQGIMLPMKARDINLEDILIALKGNDETIGVSYNGDFINCDNNANNINLLPFSWQLGIPLDQQSDETIEVLNKIIK